MARLYLVRHGKAAASWGEEFDPGLDPLGHEQAAAMARRFAEPLPLVVSPMRRARETAAALERAWGYPGRIEPVISEVPSPPGDAAARRAWLDRLMAGRWADAPALAGWRETLLRFLRGAAEDAVLVSHFIAINVAVGEALGDDRVVCFRPDYCSVTELEADGRTLRLVALGQEAATEVR